METRRPDLANLPEYENVETFVEFLLDDERETFTAADLQALNYRLRTPVGTIKTELEGYGLKLEHRPHERKVRGFTANPHDRWYGPGSCRTHGGSGWSQITGFAGQEG